jgi:hypothetical protein
MSDNQQDDKSCETASTIYITHKGKNPSTKASEEAKEEVKQYIHKYTQMRPPPIKIENNEFVDTFPLPVPILRRNPPVTLCDLSDSDIEVDI